MTAPTLSWKWDGANWVQRATTIPSTNPLRSNSAIAYDPIRRRTVIFGGRTPSTFFGDTLEWDGSTWTNVTPATGPNPRNRAAGAMAYHAELNRIVLHNGNFANGSLNDTWYWDGIAWTEIFPGTPPDQRGNSGMVYDSLRDRLVLFGGSSSTHYNDLWSFTSVTPARLGSFGQGCAGTAPSPTMMRADHRLPWLGDSYGIAVNGLPSNGLVVFVTGVSNQTWNGLPLPLSLAALGMPGCFALTSAEVVTPVTHMGGATLNVPIPPTASLVGLSLYHQAWVSHPGAANPLGALTSDGLEAVLGRR